MLAVLAPMSKHILIIDGHPDPEPQRFVHALAQAFASGAREAGHEIRTARLSAMTFDLLRSNRDYRYGEVPEAITDVQDGIAWSDHIAVLFPLWFAFAYADGKAIPKKRLKGKSAHIVATMGMLAAVYRWYFRAHSVKNVERNILRFVGFGPIRTSIVGSVEDSAKMLERWLERIRRYGRAAS